MKSVGGFAVLVDGGGFMGMGGAGFEVRVGAGFEDLIDAGSVVLTGAGVDERCTDDGWLDVRRSMWSVAAVIKLK